MFGEVYASIIGSKGKNAMRMTGFGLIHIVRQLLVYPEIVFLVTNLVVLHPGCILLLNGYV